LAQSILSCSFLFDGRLPPGLLPFNVLACRFILLLGLALCGQPGAFNPRRLRRALARLLRYPLCPFRPFAFGLSTVG